MNIAVIPARGGSKRIPRKNIRNFCGKPMIAWSIEAAHISGLFDHIIVSTDDIQIANYAKKLGATAPFIRPKNLSNDTASTIPIIKHAIEWLEDKKNNIINHACCIYATAPFLTSLDLIRGYEILTSHKNIDFTIPITTFSFPIFRSLKKKNDQIEMFYPEHALTRSQDLPEAWHDVGQFYWGKRNAWLTKDSFFTARTTGIPIPRYRVQDIDDEEDWIRAELIHTTLTKKFLK